MNKRSSQKNIDKRMDKIKAEFKKQNIVLKKNLSGISKSKSAGRYAGSLQPEPMLAAVVTYLITVFSHGTKNKKGLLKMLESQFTYEEWSGIESLVEMLMEIDEPLMERYFDDQFWIDFEPVLMEAVNIIDEFDTPKTRLTVRGRMPEGAESYVKI